MKSKILLIALCFWSAVMGQYTFTDTVYISRSATGTASGQDSVNAFNTGAQLSAYLNGKNFTSLGRLLILGYGPVINGSFAPTGYTCDTNNIPVFRSHPNWRHTAIWDTTKFGFRQTSSTPYRTVDLTLPMIFDGLLFEPYNNGTNLIDRIALRFNAAACSNSVAMNCLFVDTATTGTGRILLISSTSNVKFTGINNIFYGGNTGYSGTNTSGRNLIANNTFINQRTAVFTTGSNGSKVVNNLVIGTIAVDVPSNANVAGSNNNILTAAAPTCTECWSSNGVAATAYFKSPSIMDFRLRDTCYRVNGLGVNLSTNNLYTFNNDFRGVERPAKWDIGAEEQTTKTIVTKRIFIDSSLSANCIGYTYNPTTKLQDTVNGSNLGFKNLHKALEYIHIGDTIMGRNGTYKPEVAARFVIPTKNGTSFGPDSHYTVMSYPGEWMILDGENIIPETEAVAVLYNSAVIKYWVFERFEIKNGGSASGLYARGFHADGGPFKFRYLYIHDNLSTTSSNNPCGIGGHGHDSCLFEYNYFKDNGSNTVNHWNCSHVILSGDYLNTSTPANGFTYQGQGIHTRKNVLRYNRFENGSCGIWSTKAPQFFTGRSVPDHPYNDTYNTWGNDIYGNIFKNLRYIALVINQDFIQVHNNIIDSCQDGIVVDFTTTTPQTYRSVIYNNTVQKAAESAISIFQAGDEVEGRVPNIETQKYAYIYNNIGDSVTHTRAIATWPGLEEFALADEGSLVGGTSDSVYFTNNYSYRPLPQTGDLDASRPINWLGSRYTIAEFAAIRPTVKLWLSQYNANNKLYQADTGWRAYIPNTSHTVNTDTLLINSGVGGNHPFLPGVTLPTYLGASSGTDTLTWKNVYNLTQLATIGATWLPETLSNNTSSITITVQPTNNTVVAGGTALFSITATGDSLHYAWYRQGLYTGISSTTYSFAATPAMHNDSIQCVVWNSADTIGSNVVRVYVVYAVFDSVNTGDSNAVYVHGNFPGVAAWAATLSDSTLTTLDGNSTNQQFVYNHKITLSTNRYSLVITNGEYTVTLYIGRRKSTGNNSLSIGPSLKL